jgi:hypothetical protein
LYFDFLSILLAVRDDDHYGQSRVQGERGRWIIIARSLGEIASIPSLKKFLWAAYFPIPDTANGWRSGKKES